MTISRSPDTSYETELESAATEWDGAIAALRRRYPDASNGILFCVHKLQQDQTLTLRDFRKEAELHGIPLGGRSLHSARVLLGLERPAARRRVAKTGSRNIHQENDSGPLVEGSLEAQVIHAVTQIQEAATEQSQRLREAMKEAIRILTEALDD